MAIKENNDVWVKGLSMAIRILVAGLSVTLSMQLTMMKYAAVPTKGAVRGNKSRLNRWL